MTTIFVPGRWFCLAAVVLALVVTALPSSAQVSGPCAETITTYCKDVIPGDGRIMKCLNDHQSDQSIACKDWLEDQNKSLKELYASCPEEIVRLCNDSSASSIRMYLCLDANYIALKSACREKLREIKDRMQ